MKLWGIVLLSLLPTLGFASDAEALPGIWLVPADEPLYQVSLTVTETGNGRLLEGVIVETLDGAPETCRRCRGDMRGQPLLGMTLLTDVYLQGTFWGGGKMLDPVSGREWVPQFVISVDQQQVDINLADEKLGAKTSQTWQRAE